MTSEEFERRNRERIQQMAEDSQLRGASRHWFVKSVEHEYSYHFSWMGLPIIQYPQDIVAMQEIIWSVRPEVIVETGVARGGSLVYYASLLELIGGSGQVIGIDVDIRKENLAAIDAHPMRQRISLVTGSSTAADVVDQVRALTAGRRSVMVVLDSNHAHDHVLRELEVYSPLVTKGSYLIVFDTVIETIPEVSRGDRSWHPGNSPLTAVREFLKGNDRFEVDTTIDAKLQISVAPSGYLKCLRDL
jgi:cephalosporin hydroxylase